MVSQIGGGQWLHENGMGAGWQFLHRPAIGTPHQDFGRGTERMNLSRETRATTGRAGGAHPVLEQNGIGLVRGSQFIGLL
jgi:hypothetical protein